MSVTPLTAAAPIFGTFNATGVSAPFSVPIPDGSSPPVLMSSGTIRPFWSLQATFGSGASGMLTVTKSKDGGSTFQPIMAGQNVISVLSATGALNLQQLDPSWIYRLEASLSAGSVSYSLTRQRLDTSIATIDMEVCNDPNFPLSYMPAAGYWCIYDGTRKDGASSLYGPNTAPLWPTQAQKLYEAIWTPLQDADISGTLTGYKGCVYPFTNADGSVTKRNAFAKLTIPSDASRNRVNNALGTGREIRASKVTVLSLVDVNGSPFASALDPYDNTVSFASGSTISVTYTADSRTGIKFMPTLLEAINFQSNSNPSSGGYYPPLPNFTALSA